MCADFEWEIDRIGFADLGLNAAACGGVIGLQEMPNKQGLAGRDVIGFHGV